MKKNLRIIYTGGTIGSSKEIENEDIVKKDLEGKKFIDLLFEKAPNLEEKFNIKLTHSTPFVKFSENILPSDWADLAEYVDKAIQEKVDSIVIAHGTDTMSYTSAALSFMLQGIKIPVVLTGANIPLKCNGTDAVTNIKDAIRLTLDKRFKGIFLVFSGIENKPSDIHLGCRVRKIKLSENCFESINADMIGTFEKNFNTVNDIKFWNEGLLNQVAKLNEDKRYELKNDVDENVSFFKLYPGFNPDLIDYAIEKEETKGIILELYNLGTGCIVSKYSLLKSLQKAKSKPKPIPVFITSQHKGNVTMEKYPSSKKLKESYGAIPLKTMITEAAIPKLMWVLKQKDSKEEIINMMQNKNLCGEIDL